MDIKKRSISFAEIHPCPLGSNLETGGDDDDKDDDDDTG